ncbi:hypothetical protein B7463_g5636, partial [Scytalidium lignicola]
MMADIPRRKPMPAGFQPQPAPQAFNNHSRTRTTSSNTFPTAYYQPQQQQHQQQQQQQYPSNMQINTYTSRRTPSTNTFSTSGSSGNGPVPNRQSSTDLRRSISSRSGGASSQPSSYVALMRRQKATVWCERAQHEDPRLVAAQKAAKLRATLEVIGGPRTSTLSSTSGGKSKIRHHGKATLVGYTPGDLVGGVGGVPMRLSASEVEGGDSDDETGSGPLYHHRRTGSGRSSVSSGRKAPTYSRHSGASSMLGRRSSGNTPPSERDRQNSMSDLMESGETPMQAHVQSKDYFAASGGGDGTRSVGSGSSAERADDVPELNTADTSKLASKPITREKSLRNPEDLRRRGSVDERTMTLTAGRLYIANPDESD